MQEREISDHEEEGWSRIKGLGRDQTLFSEDEDVPFERYMGTNSAPEAVFMFILRTTHRARRTVPPKIVYLHQFSCG